MAPNVLRYEPSLALFVPGADPLLFYKAIAVFAQTHLQKSGTLYFEIHEEQAGAIAALFASYGFNQLEIKKDLQGKERMVKVMG